MSTDPAYERHRIDLTGQCLGVDDLPIRGPDGKEFELPEISEKRIAAAIKKAAKAAARRNARKTAAPPL